MDSKWDSGSLGMQPLYCRCSLTYLWSNLWRVIRLTTSVSSPQNILLVSTIWPRFHCAGQPFPQTQWHHSLRVQAPKWPHSFLQRRAPLAFTTHFHPSCPGRFLPLTTPDFRNDSFCFCFNLSHLLTVTGYSSHHSQPGTAGRRVCLCTCVRTWAHSQPTLPAKAT